MYARHYRFVCCCISSVLIVFSICVPSTLANPSVAVVDPRCEYLTDPLGIDVVQPRLSWKLQALDSDARGLKQTQYHILVSISLINLMQHQGDLWDSGEVTSNQSVNIEYAGKPLQTGMECFWKVRVRDQNGEWSAWSEPARWSMGLLDPSDWKARWIGTNQQFQRQQGWPPPDNTIPDPWFRKTFVLEDYAQKAVISVASVGYHELYVNGQKIGDAILSPSVATHKVRARYITYEIEDYLKPGKNVIGLWLGVSWSIFPHYKTDDKPQSPIVIAQADIELNNGAQLQVITDKSWKTHDSPNTLLGVWDFMHYGGELYNANQDIPNWCAPELDDSTWQQATEYTPKLILSAEMIEPNRIVETIHPIAVEKIGDKTYRVDMGVNFTGWTSIFVKGNQGQTIEFQFSERLDRHMTHRLRSVYIIGPEKQGTFKNRFNYSAGRWITIIGLEYRPSLEDIVGYMVRTDYRRAGTFHCSNPLLNEIYNRTLWTFENLSLGGYLVDCSQRERMGYGGDAHATTETGLNNYDLAAFYTKWSQDWRDVQDEKGNLPYTAPTYWGGGGPGWSGFCVTLPWEIYKRYNDTRILEINFPTIQQWLAFLETQSKDNMLVRWGGQWDFLGDWLWPGAQGVNGDYRGTLFFNNCYWIYNLQTAAAIADVLGRSDIAEQYNERADRIRAAVHNEFYNPDDHCYVTGFQAYLAIALLVNLPPQKLQPVIWKRLEEEIVQRRNGHIHAGITGGAFLFKTLLAFDRQDLIYTMATQPDYPGWGDMIHRGATTIWEAWDGDNSIMHSSYLYIGTWFIEGLAGIKLDRSNAGFQQFIIKPGLFGNHPLKYAHAEYNSMHGLIVSDWKCNIAQNQYVFSFEIPPNTTAKVTLPFGGAAKMTEMQQPLDEVEGASIVERDEHSTVLSLESGRYFFEVDLSGN